MKTAFIFVGGVTAVLAALLLMQRRADARLRDRNQSLEEQVGQLSSLAEQNLVLSNPLAQASRSEAAAKKQLNELLRSRPAAAKPGHATAAAAPTGQPAALPAAEDAVQLPRTGWTDAGFATPGAALQTRGWAVVN